MLNLLFCGVDNYGKIWTACWQHEIQYKEWKLMNACRITCKYFLRNYLYNICGKNILIIEEN